MQVEQIYTGCLAQGAYYITSNGEAAIIDPLREVQPYLERLKRDGVTLKYIFETHFHADFVSGHLDLSKETGAPIVYGPNAHPEFEFISATDGQEFIIGKVKLKTIHTPGHTLESTCYLLKDEQGKDRVLFSGDTLFIGDVGRPDLSQKAAHLTQEELAGTLYRSLRTRVMTLADDVIVYPAHGAGSACGKNMSKETVSTIGDQKMYNYALRADMTEPEFIKEVTEGLLPAPAYFSANVAMNKQGYQSYESVLDKGLRALDPAEFEAIAEETGALILDTRNNSDFYKGFIPQSVNIGLNGDFAPWVGSLIADVRQQILLVTDQGMEEETVTRLSRVGFDSILGHLKGGIEAWKSEGKETDQVRRINAVEFIKDFDAAKTKVIDIRKESEYDDQHIGGASNKPLIDINQWIEEIDPNEHFYLHCAGGYRSMMAASILQARGYRNFSEIEGGISSLNNSTIPLKKK